VQGTKSGSSTCQLPEQAGSRCPREPWLPAPSTLPHRGCDSFVPFVRYRGMTLAKSLFYELWFPSSPPLPRTDAQGRCFNPEPCDCTTGGTLQKAGAMGRGWVLGLPPGGALGPRSAAGCQALMAQAPARGGWPCNPQPEGDHLRAAPGVSTATRRRCPTLHFSAVQPSRLKLAGSLSPVFLELNHWVLVHVPLTSVAVRTDFRS
jgi:hypothetical protein